MTVIKTPIYIGIENEFQLMKGNRYMNFGNYFRDFKKAYSKKYFGKSGTAMRTVSGTSIYNDIQEPEVCIPPVKIEKGAATNASDLLYLARKELIDFMKPLKKEKNLDLIGYTSHFSITNSIGIIYGGNTMEHMTVPYSLLCLNPTSTGIGLRPKDERLELVGDFIPDIDQNRAFLNFYMGTMLLLGDNTNKLPFYAIRARNMSENLVRDGRYSKIDIRNKDGTKRTIYAQDYLEKYYSLFKKNIEEFATESEMKNLEDFIYRRKQLEIDKFKKWAHGSIYKDDKILRYNEDLIVKDSDYLEEKNLPDLTSKFLSRIVSTDSIGLKNMEWDEINFKIPFSGKSIDLNGIYNQERLEKLLQNCEKTPEEIPHIIRKYTKIMNIFGTNDAYFVPENEDALCEFSKNLLEGRFPSENCRKLTRMGLFRNRKPTDFGRNFANAVLSTKCEGYDASKNAGCLCKNVKIADRTLEYDASKDNSLPDFEEKMEKAFLSKKAEDYENYRMRQAAARLQDLESTCRREESWSSFFSKTTRKAWWFYYLAIVAGIGFSIGNYCSFRPEKEKTECAAPVIAVAADSAKTSSADSVKTYVVDSMKTVSDNEYIWKNGGIKE
ncbi:MAG: hypothetical protein WC475_01280 [Candidatus Paceibacterota bacterium]